MKRTISEDVRRKLQEAATGKWAKASAKSVYEAQSSVPAIVEALDVASLKRRAGSGVTVRGLAYYVDKRRFKLKEETADSVAVSVRGSENYTVFFDLEPDGEVFTSCDCPYSDYEDEIICKHKIAAALYLKDLYSKRPANRTTVQSSLSSESEPAIELEDSRWRESLAALLRRDLVPNKSQAVEAILFFTFIRRNHRYVVQPGIVVTHSIPSELYKDRDALREHLLDNREPLRLQTYPLSSHHLDSYQYVNAEPAQQMLVYQAESALQSGYYNYNYGYGYNAEARAWAGLSAALTFLGNEQQLIKQPLDVLPGKAQIELELQRQEDGIHLTPMLVLADRAISLKANGLEVFNQSPLWLRDGQQIFQAGIEQNRFNLLRQQKT